MTENIELSISFIEPVFFNYRFIDLPLSNPAFLKLSNYRLSIPLFLEYHRFIDIDP